MVVAGAPPFGSPSAVTPSAVLAEDPARPAAPSKSAIVMELVRCAQRRDSASHASSSRENWGGLKSSRQLERTQATPASSTMRSSWGYKVI